jgi:hypothetical protein
VTTSHSIHPITNRPCASGSPASCCSSFIERAITRFYCELRDHGRYGIEAQFFDGVDFLRSRRFDPSLDPMRSPREMAIAWALEERQAIEKGGAS